MNTRNKTGGTILELLVIEKRGNPTNSTEIKFDK
jgi:hypothetical protein